MTSKSNVKAARTLLESVFLRNGYIKVKDENLLMEQGWAKYKKGFEVRLIPQDKIELKQIREAIKLIGYNPEKTFKSENRVIQPIYEGELILYFQNLLLNTSVPDNITDFRKNPAKGLLHTKQSLIKIQSVICRHFKIKPQTLKLPNRKEEIVLIRHLVMYFCRKLTSKTLREIGEEIGERNHATVLFGYNKIDSLKRTNLEIAQHIETIYSKLK